MDENIILTKIAEIESYVEEIRAFVPASEEEYISDRKTKLSIERLLQLAVDATIDVCSILVKEFKLGPPRDEDNILTLLHDKIEHVQIIKDMKSFRNILVHRYGIIDDARVYDMITNELDDFDVINDEFRALLKNED